MKWKAVCLDKTQGGLNIKEVLSSNKAVQGTLLFSLDNNIVELVDGDVCFERENYLVCSI